MFIWIKSTFIRDCFLTGFGSKSVFNAGLIPNAGSLPFRKHLCSKSRELQAGKLSCIEKRKRPGVSPEGHWKANEEAVTAAGGLK